MKIIGNMWDSKKVISSEQVAILYSGNALESRKNIGGKSEFGIGMEK